MNSMTFSVILIMFAPVIAVIALLAGIIIADVQYKKQSKYEHELMQRCIQEKGYDYVERIINIAKECSLGKEFIIKSLEQAIGIKQPTKERENEWVGHRIMQHITTKKDK